jgi:SpoVK/Ycf46/Vps4 family AAA+-type ATPase
VKDDNRFMNELFRIVSGALRLDLERVRNYTSFLADKLEKSGDLAAATRLRRLLDETQNELRPANLATARIVPVDSESRFPLIERVNLRGIEEPAPILTEAQAVVVREFLSVAKSYAQLEAAGIATTGTLMLYGPPGCGKSHLARYIARQLGLDMYVARLDGLISSFLGSTSKNIRALFDFASKNPCVLFLDEFDAIAKLRGDAQELGELKRVVNSFIQSLDTIGKDSIIIAATNHEDLLDAAIWRRFTYRLELTYPTQDQRAQLWTTYLKPIKFAKRNFEALVDLSEGFSGSDIHEVTLRLNRGRVIARSRPTLHDAYLGLVGLTDGTGESRRFLSGLRSASAPTVARALRERNQTLYSHAVIGAVLGVSKATAFRLTQLKKVPKHG